MNKRILLVEDNEDLRYLLGIFLSDTFNVTEAEDGLIAFDKIQNESFDLIISDCNMPNMDGPTLIEKVKSLHPGIPVILISAQISFSDLLFENKNIIAVFSKPFSPIDLLLKVKEILA